MEQNFNLFQNKDLYEKTCVNSSFTNTRTVYAQFTHSLRTVYAQMFPLGDFNARLQEQYAKKEGATLTYQKYTIFTNIRT